MNQVQQQAGIHCTTGYMTSYQITKTITSIVRDRIGLPAKAMASCQVICGQIFKLTCLVQHAYVSMHLDARDTMVQSISLYLFWFKTGDVARKFWLKGKDLGSLDYLSTKWNFSSDFRLLS